MTENGKGLNVVYRWHCVWDEASGNWWKCHEKCTETLCRERRKRYMHNIVRITDRPVSQDDVVTVNWFSTEVNQLIRSH